MAELTIPILLGAALVDSINPCVIGVLVFLLGYITRVIKSSKMMLFISIIYTLVVYVTYLALGLGILNFVKGALPIEATEMFYIFAGVIAAIAGVLEMKDFFWYGRGVSLQIFPSTAKRLKYYTKKFVQVSRKSMLFSVLFASGLGVFVVLIELPCTGAPYLAVIGMLSVGSYSEAVPLLMLYNLVFIMPLLVVISLAYLGHSLQKMQKWKQKHKKWMRLFMGMFLLGLAAYMFYTIGIGF